MNRYIFALIVLCTVSPLTFGAQPNLPVPQEQGFQIPPHPVAPQIMPPSLRLRRQEITAAMRAARQPHQYANQGVRIEFFAQPASSPMDTTD